VQAAASYSSAFHYLRQFESTSLIYRKGIRPKGKGNTYFKSVKSEYREQTGDLRLPASGLCDTGPRNSQETLVASAAAAMGIM